MNLLNFLILSILLVLSKLSETKFRGIPRRARSDLSKRDENLEETPKDVFSRCLGYPSGLVQPEPYTSPDDSDNVSLIVRAPTQWVLRDTSFIPNPLIGEHITLSTVNFCLEGDRTLYFLKNDSDDSTYVVVDKVGNPPENSPGTSVHYRVYWDLVSIRDSPIKGHILVDIRLYSYGNLCCGIALVNNAISQYNKCDCDRDWPVLTLHAIKFVNTTFLGECVGCWEGMFTLCSSADCTERIISLQVNNEEIPLLPLVLGTYYSTVP